MTSGVKSPIAFVSRCKGGPASTWLRALANELPEETVLALDQIQERQCVEIAVLADPDPDDLLQLPNLRWAQSLWAGVDGILSEPRLAHLPIVRLIDPTLAATMAEAVLAWTLYLHRDIPSYAHSQAKQEWQPLPVIPPRERKVGIMGLGTLGQRAAQTLVANGFRVSGWSTTKKQLASVDCYCGEAGLAEMLSRSDIVVCLLPHTAQTAGLFDQTRFEVLKNGACLINLGRGSLVVEDALIAALDSGRLRHAVLDVFEREPLATGHRFWSHPNITVLPHICAPTDPLTASKIVAATIASYRRDGAVPAAVDRVKGY